MLICFLTAITQDTPTQAYELLSCLLLSNSHPSLSRVFIVKMDSQLPLEERLDSFPTPALHKQSDDQLPHDDNFPSRPRTVPAIPPGFEGNVPRPRHESKPSEMNIYIRVALLEQDLRDRYAQLDETLRANAHLSELQRTEAGRVFALVQELSQCERRAAKAEIAVEYLAELNAQIAAKVKQHGHPDKQMSILEERIKYANYESETRISALEMDIQNLSLHNEKLKSKLEHAMDTILALSSYAKTARGSNAASQAYQTLGSAAQHNNLIDLMDKSLPPTQKDPVEEQTATLPDEFYDPDEESAPAVVDTRQIPSESLDSDFSNSSYIVRFKGIRDMTKQLFTSEEPSEVAGYGGH